MFPGTIVPIIIEGPRLKGYASTFIARVDPREEEMALLNCPGCGRGGLRVPDGRRGKVTCPTCGAEWFYPETVEVSEVEFRCSSSGARFVVVLGRRSPLHKFVIQGIKNAAQRAPTRSDDMGSTRQPAKHPLGAPPTPPLLRLRARSWLARIASFKDDTVSNECAVTHHPEPTAPLMTYSAEHYNWSSFFCPRSQLHQMRGRTSGL
jgi:hypothetical protein